jgi:lysozyme
VRLSPKALAAFVAAVVAISATVIQPWEGTEYVGYADVVGITTACTGHTGPEVVLGKRYDEYQCDKWFKQDIQIAVNGVMGCVNAPMAVN